VGHRLIHDVIPDPRSPIPDVIPAQAGIYSCFHGTKEWIPVCAGMTSWVEASSKSYFRNGSSGPSGMIRVGLMVMWLQ
jgi:hypothetical protein